MSSPQTSDDKTTALSAEMKLLEIEAIKQLKARYFRFVDTKQWESLAELFTPDARADYTADAGPDAGLVQGGKQIARFISDAIGSARTVHHGHMPEIELTGPDTASGIWAMYDFVEFPSQGALAGLKGYGHYVETYRKTDRRWHIATLKLERLRVDPLG